MPELTLGLPASIADLESPLHASLRRGFLAAEGEPLRSVEHRRSFVGEPARYFAEILGWELTGQELLALATVEAHDRVLIPSGHDLGKTFLLAGYAIYRMDAVAALADPERGTEEQGGRVILAGPTSGSVYATIWQEVLAHIARAEGRGYRMPGKVSMASVHWYVGPRWMVEAFSPPERPALTISHSISGRHHPNQVVLIEEGAGVPESEWVAIEGTCSSRGNKIVSSFNPGEPAGPAYQRAERGGYVVLRFDAFEHENVRRRELVIPDAVDFLGVDRRVRECRDLGAAKDVTPDPDHGDFVYALPPKPTAREVGGRRDGVPGHPRGKPRVYRPDAAFLAQVRGMWPKTSLGGLVDPSAWTKAVERWKERELPDGPPDRVGVDAARMGDDETVVAPSWGESGEELLRAWHEATFGVDDDLKADLLEERRAYVAELQVAPKGDGTAVAEWIGSRWQDSLLLVDETGVGASVLDHLGNVLGLDAIGVSFGSLPPEPLPGEQLAENVRTLLYLRAARLVNLGLVDVPPDLSLREEVMAHGLTFTYRSVRDEDSGRPVRRPCVRLLAKDDVKKKIGRSPDRADAFVLALWRQAGPKATKLRFL